MAGQVQRVRMFGSAAIDLVWVAEGRTDAGIAREAGARVVDGSGCDHDIDSGETIAATPGLVDQVVALVQRARL